MRTITRATLRAALLLGAGLLTSLCSIPAGAVDFIRGDANGDRSVSIADARFILHYYLDGGPSPACSDAADANDNGDVDISDAAAVLSVLFVDTGYQLPAPYPDPGPDPTDGADEPRHPEFDPMKCDSWGDVAPIDDPLAHIELLDAVVPGGDVTTAGLVLAVSCSTSMAGFAVDMVLPTELRIGIQSVAPLSSGGSSRAALRGDTLSVWLLSAHPADEVVQIPPGQDIPAVEVTLCLAEGTLSGDYPIAITAAEIVDYETSRAIPAAVSGGTLTVAAALTAAPECDGPIAPPLPPPPPLDATFSLRGGVGQPGGTVEVTLAMRADAEIQGWAYSINFDESVLDALGTTLLWERPDGTPYSFIVLETNDEDDTPGDGGIDEGFQIGAAVIDFVQPIAMPANVDNEVVRFEFAIDPGAEAGSTELAFIDGGQGRGEPVPNVVIAHGQSEYTADSPGTFVFLAGFVEVLPDIITFIRGDSNRDDVVDISDAQATLGALFLGGAPLVCEDAADANDDGQVDISDPAATLGYLFLDASALPAPFPEPGADTTGDRLRCELRE